MTEQFAWFLRALSTLCGWSYVICWSLSFYPQPLLNWRRKSTHGLTADFPALNVVGFISYTVSTSSFLYSPKIRAQYAARHPVAPEPTVRFNDFAFALHALILVLLTYSQLFASIWRFEIPKSQRTSLPVRTLILGCILTVIVSIIRAASNDRSPTKSPVTTSSTWTWIDVIYLFSTIKLLATFSKYTPQVLLNYTRKSTRGWSIHQILLDFAGGILSLTQLFIDASFQKDWSGVTGNPAKLGLSNISLAFDVVFMVQHYVLYPRVEEEAGGEEDGEGQEQEGESGEREESRRPLLS